MLKIVRERWRQGHRTGKFPREAPVLPERFRGLPRIEASRCPEGCRECVAACPYGAVAVGEEGTRSRHGALPLLRRMRRGLSPRARSPFPATTGWPPGPGKD